jgi:hypothetical protein
MACTRREVNMDKRCIKAAVVLLGALVGASMFDCKSASALQNGWIQSSPSGYSTCFDAAINDSGTRAGSCLTSNQEISFVQLASASAPTQLAALPSTANGVPCGVTALSNAGAGQEIIMGWCNDANAVSQGVYWKSSTPTTAPTLLQPSSLGLAPDVQTQAVAVSAEGMMVGVSISSSGTKTPVTWSSAGVATQLQAPVGSVNTNCEPVDISDAAPPPPPYYIGERTTAIVGNCKDAGAGGGNKIVLWQSASAGYTVLAPPSGAKSCIAIAVNLGATVLGQCDYPGDVTHPVLFTAGSYSVALSAVNGAPTSKIFAVDINDLGNVACNYLNASGVKQPCLWSSPFSGTYALPIALPTPDAGIAVAIGNNGKVIGNYDVSGSGHWLPFSTPSYSLTSVSGGSPSGGYSSQQTSVSKMSRGGAFQAGTWIGADFDAVDVVKPVP